MLARADLRRQRRLALGHHTQDRLLGEPRTEIACDRQQLAVLDPVGHDLGDLRLALGQRLIEGAVWLSLPSDGSSVNAVTTYAYALFAFVLWPVFIPFAIGRLEPETRRRKMLYAVQLVGVAVAVYLLYSHTDSPVTSEIVNSSVVYANSHFYGGWVIAFYFVATIGSCLLSSRRLVNLFGALTLFAALTAYWVYATSFVSVWCFLAAVLSLIVYAVVRSAPSSRDERDQPRARRRGARRRAVQAR